MKKVAEATLGQSLSIRFLWINFLIVNEPINNLSYLFNAVKLYFENKKIPQLTLIDNRELITKDMSSDEETDYTPMTERIA